MQLYPKKAATQTVPIKFEHFSVTNMMKTCEISSTTTRSRYNDSLSEKDRNRMNVVNFHKLN